MNKTDGMTGPDQATDPAQAAAPDQAAAALGYRPSGTLPLRVETVRQLLRRRTLIAFAVMTLLPVVIWAAFAIGGTPDGRDGRVSLMQVATASGLNFSLAVLFVSSGFLVTVPVALFFGDTVASEAGWSSLRYLLAAPVPRGRLLLNKLLVSLAFSATAVLALPTVALGVGTIAYGSGDLQLPTGGSVDAGTALTRLGVIALYVFVSQLSIAGIAFWLSTVTDAPLGAVGGAVGFAILANVLDAITALGSVRNVLPTHYQFAWADLVQADAEWTGMLKGTSVAMSFAMVFFALAFRHFRNKDVVS